MDGEVGSGGIRLPLKGTQPSLWTVGSTPESPTLKPIERPRRWTGRPYNSGLPWDNKAFDPQKARERAWIGIETCKSSKGDDLN